MTETSKDAYVATGLGGQIVDIKDQVYCSGVYFL